MKRKPWQMTLDEFVYYWSAKNPVGWFLFGATTTHRSIIEHAHADGHTIPSEVLVGIEKNRSVCGSPKMSWKASERMPRDRASHTSIVGNRCLQSPGGFDS